MLYFSLSLSLSFLRMLDYLLAMVLYFALTARF
jgi:hypothetical protein